jgi:protein-tyrosine phosphatase
LFLDQGVTALVATPHVDLSLGQRNAMTARLSEIDRGWSRLEEAALGRGVAVQRGAELKLDTADPDLSDARLRLAGTRFALVELPYFTVPPRSARTLALLVQRGWVPVVAHPERYDGLDPDLDVVREWRDAGACIQVNGVALLGRYGPTAQRDATALLARGWVDYLASDYHARGRLRVREYRDNLIAIGARDQAELLTVTNPARLLRDERPLPVPPIPLALLDGADS